MTGERGGLSEAERATLQAAPNPVSILIYALSEIAGQLTTDEGDDDFTEDTFGLSVAEVVAMAHDNMIEEARRALKRFAGISGRQALRKAPPDDGEGT